MCCFKVVPVPQQSASVMDLKAITDDRATIAVSTLCSPPQWRLRHPNRRPRNLSFSSNLAPFVEVLVFSNECNALVLSPCRIHSIIEARKRLYKWGNKRKGFEKKLFLELRNGQELSKSHRSYFNYGGNGESYGQNESPSNAVDCNGNVSHNSLLGSGGFGLVFKSEYNKRSAAVKQLYQRRHRDSFDFWSLCAELNAFRLPRCPYIVSIFSFISFGSITQIVNEYVNGRDLKKLIDDDQWVIGCLDRKRIAFQVASGVAHCHSHRLLHLDVKPSNVILSADYSTCKLTDFGCSRVAEELPNGVLVAPDAASTSSFGTIAYKAPELLRGDRPTDRADVYSFALLLYELMTRSTPFSGAHPHAIIYLVGNRNIRPDLAEVEDEIVSQGSNSIDLALLEMIRRCWCANLEERPCAKSICEHLQNLADEKLV